MSPARRFWTAERLNEEAARAGGGGTVLIPWGEASVAEGAAKQLSASVLEKLRVAEAGVVACVIPIDPGIAGFATIASALCRLPPFVSLAACDPEIWSLVAIRPDAVRTVGPFRDVASPLQEWLWRALRSGKAIAVEERLADGLSQSVGEESPPIAGALPELVPIDSQTRGDWRAEYLESFDLRRMGEEVKSDADAIALSAGIWQMNDYLDRSHQLSQSIEGEGSCRAGDYWHAIMHRREPDYSNAKYWFRRVGAHPVQKVLPKEADAILESCPSVEAPRWRAALAKASRNAPLFVDFCENAASGSDSQLAQAARQIQFVEMILLLASTYHDACASQK